MTEQFVVCDWGNNSNPYICVRCGVKRTKPVRRRCGSNALTSCGPGCQLKRLLSWLNLTDDGKCNCSEHADEMDRWGPDKCRDNVSKIVDWMEEAAEERGLRFNRFAASRVVHVAIRLARHSIAKAEKASQQ